MNPTIEAALDHSPRHKQIFTAALAKVPAADIRGAAVAVRSVCDRYNIGDFPNPFPRETQARTEWAKGWDGEGEAAGKTDQMVDFSDKGAFKNKGSIIAYVAKAFGVTLDSRDYKRPALEAEAARIQAEA